MEAVDVQRLAELENQRWSGAVNGPAVAPQASSEHDHERSIPGSGGAWVAYSPLGLSGSEQTPGPDRLMNFQFIGATAVGTVLVVRFRWLPDPDQREFLLHLDFGEDLWDNLDAASVRLFECVIFCIVDAPGWYPRDTVPISSRVSLFTPRAPYSS